MRLLVVVCVLFGSGSATWLDATAAPTRASLRLVSGQPIVVRGKGFSAHERVRVTLRSPAVRTKRLRATAGGTFLVAFQGVSSDRCTGLAVTAAGPAHVATIKRPPQPECPMP